MNKFIATFCLIALLFASCNKEQPEVSSAAKTTASTFERHIPLDGEPNLRDLGGYQTSDGQTVKTGLIYRSGKLSQLNDNDVKKLEKLNIKSVVNFLTPNEIKSGGDDILPENVERLYFPIDADMGQGFSVDALIEARKTGDFANIPAELNPDIHRLLIQEARDPYTKLLRHLANADKQPTIYHCSHGVHRTGTATAIILSAIGVPWETVREDYLLSNTYRKEQVIKRTEQLKQLHAKNTKIDPKDVDMTNINAFYILEASYIDASLDEAVNDYGSIKNYIREGLGITDKEIQQLKELYLEPSS